MPKVYSFGAFWVQIYCRKTKNITKNQNFCKNYILVISDSISPRSQKSHRILAKLNKKNIF